jgi:hypothetical protein
MGQQGRQKFIPLRPMVRAGGLQQGDGLGHGAALLGRCALQDALQKRRMTHGFPRIVVDPIRSG